MAVLIPAIWLAGGEGRVGEELAEIETNLQRSWLGAEAVCSGSPARAGGRRCSGERFGGAPAGNGGAAGPGSFRGWRGRHLSGPFGAMGIGGWGSLASRARRPWRTTGGGFWAIPVRERANVWAWELHWGEVELVAELARAKEGRGGSSS